MTTFKKELVDALEHCAKWDDVVNRQFAPNDVLFDIADTVMEVFEKKIDERLKYIKSIINLDFPDDVDTNFKEMDDVMRYKELRSRVAELLELKQEIDEKENKK